MSAINKRIQFTRPRKNARSPSNHPIDGCGMPMRITRMFPMKLKDVTPEKLQDKRVESDVVCISEMMALFECFEKTDYNSSVCQQQANSLEQCYSRHMDKHMAIKRERRLMQEKNKKT